MCFNTWGVLLSHIHNGTERHVCDKEPKENINKGRRPIKFILHDLSRLVTVRGFLLVQRGSHDRCHSCAALSVLELCVDCASAARINVSLLLLLFLNIRLETFSLSTPLRFSPGLFSRCEIIRAGKSRRMCNYCQSWPGLVPPHKNVNFTFDSSPLNL